MTEYQIIRVNRVPPTAYLTAGEVYEATQTRPGGDWRFELPDGRGSYVRASIFAVAKRLGDFQQLTSLEWIESEDGHLIVEGK